MSPPGLAFGSSLTPPNGLGAEASDISISVFLVVGGAFGFQSKPGLSIKLMVSPSLTLYSLRSLPSARALPLSKSLCASAGGALGWAASWALIAETVSVGWTLRVKEAGGFRDLKTREIEAVILNVSDCKRTMGARRK